LLAMSQFQGKYDAFGDFRPPQPQPSSYSFSSDQLLNSENNDLESVTRRKEDQSKTSEIQKNNNNSDEQNNNNSKKTRKKIKRTSKMIQISEPDNTKKLEKKLDKNSDDEREESESKTRKRSQSTVLARMVAGIPQSANPATVQQWLVENSFDQKVCDALHGYSAIDVLALSREDAIMLLGTADGIKLYNRIQLATSALDSAMQSDGGELYGRQTHTGRGFLGVDCSVIGCKNPARYRCCLLECRTPLCIAHTKKMLFTNYLYCPACYVQQPFYLRPADYCPIQ